MKKLRASTKVPLLILSIYCLLALSSSLTWLWGTDEASAFASAIVIQVLTLVMPTLFYSRLCRLSFTKKLNIRVFSLSKILLLIGLLGVMIFGTLTVSILWSMVVGSISGGTAASGDSMSTLESANVLYVVFALCIVPAVCEEFVFRGVILSEYSPYGPATAIVISSMTFAMAHFSFDELPTRFFCGVILAASLYMTKSLLAPIILHIANNLASVYLLPYIKEVVLQPRGVLFSVFIVTTLFLVFLCVVFREAEGVYFEYAYDERNAARGMSGKAPGKTESAASAFFSLTLIVCILFFVIMSLVG